MGKREKARGGVRRRYEKGGTAVVYMKRLTDDDILNLYREFETPEHVKRHCFGVTKCAMKLAEALMVADASIKLDLKLIYGAGMVHDMARTRTPHEEWAADKLMQLGYPEEAEIIRYHMKCNVYNDIEHVTEADLLYLSDRLVLEDSFVGLEKRFEYLRAKMLKLGRDPYNEHSVTNYKNTEKLVKQIEEKTGRSMADICG